MEILWSWTKEGELNPEEMLLAKNDNRLTAWQMAAEKCHLEVLKKLWVCAIESQLNPKELKNKLYYAWYRAAAEGSLELLETLWIWALEAELTADDLFLAQNETGRTALHMETM